MKYKLSIASCIFVKSVNFILSIKFEYIKMCKGVGKNIITLLVEDVPSSRKKLNIFR